MDIRSSITRNLTNVYALHIIPYTNDQLTAHHLHNNQLTVHYLSYWVITGSNTYNIASFQVIYWCSFGICTISKRHFKNILFSTADKMFNPNSMNKNNPMYMKKKIIQERHAMHNLCCVFSPQERGRNKLALKMIQDWLKNKDKNSYKLLEVLDSAWYAYIITLNETAWCKCTRKLGEDW